MRDKKFFTTAVFLFITINLLFNFYFWQEIGNPSANRPLAVGDSLLAEFIAENNYQNVINFRNPFILEEKIFYPYDTNIALNDPGLSNVLFSIFLRPFFDAHKTSLIVVLLNILLSNVLMFLLLLRLKVDKYAALIVGLLYGYASIAAFHFFGHFTYTSTYIFPLLFLLTLNFITEKTHRKKLFLALGITVLVPLILLLNFYYFIGIIIATIFYLAYYFVKNRSETVFLIKGNLKYLALMIPIIFLILFPWMTAVYKFNLFEGGAQVEGFAGAITLSGDLLGIVTPSENNPIYRFLITKSVSAAPILNKYAQFYFNNWVTYIYPGALILITFVYLLYRRKKIQNWEVLKPHFYASLLFFVLTLGPFLKIANRWMLVLDEGIPVVFPLPFLLLRYLPGFSGLRAPTRFVPLAVFFASIVAAYVLTQFFSKSKEMKKTLIIIGALLLVIFDQLYIYPKQSNTYIPTKAYQVIKEDNDSGTVLEIPYSVRDGFNYIGYVHAISPMNGQLLHQKPIIGGYEARVNPSVFEYYKSLPFMGYTARIIDKGNYEPLKQQPGETKLEPLQTDLETIKNELNFLNIRYLLLKNNEKYSPIFTQIISSLDFQKKTSDGEYDLYERNFKSGNYDTISFGQDADYLHLAQGFSFKEPGFRWADEKIAKVFIKTSNVKKNKLTFELESFYQPQEVSIFVNNIKIKTLMIDVSKKSYTVEIKGLIIDGINDIQFTFSKNTKPSDIFPNDKDERALAAKFYSLKIE